MGAERCDMHLQLFAFASVGKVLEALEIIRAVLHIDGSLPSKRVQYQIVGEVPNGAKAGIIATI